MKKYYVLLSAALLVGVTMTGCTSSNETVKEEQVEAGSTVETVSKSSPSLSYDGDLVFQGESDFQIAYDEIYKMPSVTRTVTHLSSTGEEEVNEVEGILLEDLLAQHGLDQKSLGTLRFTAGDGYAVDVPQEIVQEKEIILAWQFDGETLEDKKLPLRVAIDGVRSMYYVSNLAEVTIGQAKDQESLEMEEAQTIVLLDTATTQVESVPFTYYESEDTAILAEALIEKFVTTHPESILFKASDGYEKTESFETVYSGYLKDTGEDAPLFIAKDLPKGMNVKDILTMEIGAATFVSVESSLDALENIEIEDTYGVSLESLVGLVGLEAEQYLLKATDGYEKVVDANTLDIGVVYLDESGTATVQFNDENPSRSKVKDLLSIEGVYAPTSEGVSQEQTDSENDTTGDAPEIYWEIEVNGLLDGSFVMDSGRAAQRLELVDLHTQKKKDDVVIPEDWKGYRVLDLLAFLKVESFNSLVFTAEDGYEVELSFEQVDDETLLAIMNNGELLSDPENKVQLVQNTEFAATWVKNIAKITVK